MAAKSAFGAPASEIAVLFADYLEGDASRPAFVLSRRELDAGSRNALEKSLESFGYSPQPCTFATLLPRNPDAEGGDISLDAQALFLLVEGFDPLYVIAADADAASTLSQAYRTQLAPDAPARVFGRPAATFKSLPTLIQTTPGKQKAWQILKTLNA